MLLSNPRLTSWATVMSPLRGSSNGHLNRRRSIFTLFSFQCCAQRLNSERRRVLLARRQPAERAYDLLPRQTLSLFHRHSFDHLGEHRAAGERRGAAVGEESRGLDAPVSQSQTEAQPITADGIGLLGDGCSIRQLADAARVGKMVFESFGVRQGQVS